MIGTRDAAFPRRGTLTLSSRVDGQRIGSVWPNAIEAGFVVRLVGIDETAAVFVRVREGGLMVHSPARMVWVGRMTFA